jgi:osmotically-inducible protein OsmY
VRCQCPPEGNYPAKTLFPQLKQPAKPAVTTAECEQRNPAIFQPTICRERIMENEGNRRFVSSLTIMGLAAACLLAGCNNGPKYPDSKPQVTSSLAQDNLSNLTVSQDRKNGVITLTGTVPSKEEKLQAEDIAKTAAPKYRIADQTTVAPAASSGAPVTSAVVAGTPSQTDAEIQQQFNAKVNLHHSLARAGNTITGTSKNGVLIITGKVRTKAEKREVEKLANSIPHVQQIEDDLTIM